MRSGEKCSIKLVISFSDKNLNDYLLLVFDSIFCEFHNNEYICWKSYNLLLLKVVIVLYNQNCVSQSLTSLII